MLELYQAYADYEDMMRLTEDLVATAARGAIGRTRVNGAARDRFQPTWQRIPLRDAIAEFSGVDYNAYPIRKPARCGRQAGLRPEAWWNRARSWTSCLRHSSSKADSATFLVDYRPLPGRRWPRAKWTIPKSGTLRASALK